MGYEIEFDDASKIVTVKYTGRVSLNERLSAVEEVSASYSHLNPLRILIDVVSLDMQLSYKEQKNFGTYLATNRRLKNARVAVFHQANNNPNVFVDSTAFLNGYQLAQFDNEKGAHSWLMDR